jgi:hypothetical protein
LANQGLAGQWPAKEIIFLAGQKILGRGQKSAKQWPKMGKIALKMLL